MRYLALVTVVILLSSCASKKPVVVQKQLEVIADLKKYPQDVSSYTKSIESNSTFSQSEYERNYFRVWNEKVPSISVEDAKWAHIRFHAANSYGENLQPINQRFFDAMLKNANFEDFATLNKKALSLHLLNLRAMPTDRPLLLDPKKAGEGYPFDYLQNSTVAPNKPLLLSHYSKDGAWAFVETSFTYGWVKSSEIVILKDIYATVWQRAKQIVLTKEGEGIYSKEGVFLFQSRVGMMLPLISEDAKSYKVLTISKLKYQKPLYEVSTISKEIAHNGTIAFNRENINRIITEVSKTNYGWGGLYGQRDCSSTLRDFFAPFGVWLPRNSSKQAASGEVISLEGLSNQEKLERIKEQGVPFRTLIYKPGHIALYVGVKDDAVIIFQNVWGVKTKKEGKEGRFVIGKPIFSTLEVGKNLKYYDKNASMLTKLKSMTML